MKDYNFKRHFEKNYEAYQSLVGEKKTQKIEKLKKEFIAQQLMFKKSNQESQASLVMLATSQLVKLQNEEKHF